MRRVDKVRLRLRSLFRRERVEQELDEELRFHLERQIEENVAAGMGPGEARRTALKGFGGVEQIKADCRDARGLSLLESLVQDLRFAFRLVRRNQGFTVAVVVTLALGIGANTAIFSVVHAVLLRPLPYPAAERLLTIGEQSRLFFGFSTLATYRAWREQNRTFEQMAAYTWSRFVLTGDGEAEEVSVGLVDSEFFALLGVKPHLGAVLQAG